MNFWEERFNAWKKNESDQKSVKKAIAEITFEIKYKVKLWFMALILLNQSKSLQMKLWLLEKQSFWPPRANLSSGGQNRRILEITHHDYEGN